MTAKTAEQIETELKELTASKKELESKIASLNQDLFKIKSDEEKDRQISKIAGTKMLINQKESITRSIIFVSISKQSIQLHSASCDVTE